MTRKDFELIASTLKTYREYADDRTTCDEIAKEFAHTLKGTSARFDAQRFLLACGVTRVPL